MITIRDYKPSDAKALWNIFFHTIRYINSRDYSQDQVEAWAPESLDSEIWKNRMKILNPFVAEIQGTIAGYADLQSNGLIDHFFCHHEFQRQGVGSALMEHIFCSGKRADITRFYSEVSITAKPFYEHFGFSVVQEQLLEMRGQELRNVIMEKNS
jgi:putative acetyltransferase